MLRPPACLTMILLSLAPALAQDESVLAVSLLWPGHDLSRAQVRAHRDKERRDLVAAFPSLDAGGKVMMTLTPGTYYLSAVVDADNDGKLSAGDGLGFYGVEDPNTQQPQAYDVKDKLAKLRLTISLAMGPDGKLAPTDVKAGPEEEGPPLKLCRVAGTLTAGSGKFQAIYMVAADGRSSYAALPADGAFELTVPAGAYYVFAAEDSNDTEGLDPGDVFAVHGYDAKMGREFPTVQVQDDVSDLALKFDWRVSDSGLLRSPDEKTEGPQVALETLPALLVISLDNLPAESAASVCVSSDARFTEIVQVGTSRDGAIALTVPPGEYYLNAASLAHRDSGARSAGDLIGFYGVTDLRKAHGPQPLALRPGEIRQLIIPLIAKLDEQLHPVPLDIEPGPAH